jgi:hypothetical protein
MSNAMPVEARSGQQQPVQEQVRLLRHILANKQAGRHPEYPSHQTS